MGSSKLLGFGSRFSARLLPAGAVALAELLHPSTTVDLPALCCVTPPPGCLRARMKSGYLGASRRNMLRIMAM